MHLSLTEKQIKDLNRMNKASQNAQLGTLLQELIDGQDGGGGGGDSAIIQKTTYLEFPNIGSSSYLYIDTTTNISYRWDNTSKKYYSLNADYKNIKQISGGNANG
jgi:hypothetical protein